MNGRKYYYYRCYGLPFYYQGLDWMRDINKNKSTAVELLKIRYANGEINKEEYGKILKDIQ
jgi:uncharacterized membrane protein